MQETREQQIRQVLASQQFGVLATLFGGRLHTSTIHFAETPELELVFAIQPSSLKARLAAGNPRAAFQVDNRAILLESRERFTRISFEGALRHVLAEDPEHDRFRRIFAAKLPVGERLLSHPEIAVYVLSPTTVRFAAGAATPEDIPVTYEDDAPPEPVHAATPLTPADGPIDHVWATPLDAHLRAAQIETDKPEGRARDDA